MLSRFILFAGLVAVAGFSAKSQSARSYYELRVVHYHTPEQGERLDAYLKNAWVPALHRAGVASVGVWTAVGNDTAADKKMVLLIPVRTLQQIMDIRQKLDKDKIYWEAGKDVKQAAYDNPAYDRIETIILLAFPLAPSLKNHS